MNNLFNYNQNQPLSMGISNFSAPATPTSVPAIDPQLLQSGLNVAGAGGTPTSPAPVVPAGAGGAGGFMGQFGGLEGLANIAKGIGSIGSVYAAIKGLGLARDQLDFSKEAYQTNLANSTKSFNTALEDRIRARAATENRGASYADDYLAKHRL